MSVNNNENWGKYFSLRPHLSLFWEGSAGEGDPWRNRLVLHHRVAAQKVETFVVKLKAYRTIKGSIINKKTFLSSEHFSWTKKLALSHLFALLFFPR